MAWQCANYHADAQGPGVHLEVWFYGSVNAIRYDFVPGPVRMHLVSLELGRIDDPAQDVRNINGAACFCDFLKFWSEAVHERNEAVHSHKHYERAFILDLLHHVIDVLKSLLGGQPLEKI